MAELRRTYNRRTAGQKASGRGSRRARKKRNPAAAGILILLAVLLEDTVRGIHGRIIRHFMEQERKAPLCSAMENRRRERRFPGTGGFIFR